MFDLLLKGGRIYDGPACRVLSAMAVAGQRAPGVHHKVVGKWLSRTAPLQAPIPDKYCATRRRHEIDCLVGWLDKSLIG